MVTAVRTAVSAWKDQRRQPVSASREKTLPCWLPTNTFPATMVGWPKARESPSKPKAHLSFRRGTSAAERPAMAAGWKRWFDKSGLQPFHCGTFGSTEKLFDDAGHRPTGGWGAASDFARGAPPVRNAAMASRWAGVRDPAISRITPVSRVRAMDVAGMYWRVVRSGARCPELPSWQTAQRWR